MDADDTEGPLDQIARLALNSGLDLGWRQLLTSVTRLIDVVAQMDATSADGALDG